MAPTTRVRAVDLGLPPDARYGYGSSIVGVPSRRTFLFTYIEPPAAIRLVRFDLDEPGPQVLRGVRGELRPSLFDREHGRLHALTSHGLFEVTLDPFAVARKLEAKMAPHPACLVPAPDGERAL